VRGMKLTFDSDQLEKAVAEHKKMEGIADIRV
jgi:hypothetical protein